MNHIEGEFEGVKGLTIYYEVYNEIEKERRIVLNHLSNWLKLKLKLLSFSNLKQTLSQG